MVVTLGDFLATGGLTAWFSCAVVIVFTIENKVRMTKPDTIFFISAPFAFVMMATHRRCASVCANLSRPLINGVAASDRGAVAFHHAHEAVEQVRRVVR